jgi:acyl-CoA thioester hydrolase
VTGRERKDANVKWKVYYADTDAGGVVYYANYLRWLEMARSELVDSFGTSVAEYAQKGYLFIVARVEVDYLVPAVLGDEVRIDSHVERVRHVRFIMQQKVLRCRDDVELVKAKVILACVSPEGKLQTLPEPLAVALRTLIPGQS